MKNNIEDISAELNATDLTNAPDADLFRIQYLSKKGKISLLFDELKTMTPDEKKIYGAQINKLKIQAEQILETIQNNIQVKDTLKENSDFDYSLPNIPHLLGSRHPISIIKHEMIEIFQSIGFNVSEGPEIEDDHHNFSALNFAPNHPARDMQDTFFVHSNPDITLRTHTSSVQVRVFENQKPPIRTLAPGRVYRNEAISARAHCFFHQLEGFYVNENVSFKDLKNTLYYFAKEMFGSHTKIRFRPSFFPFTEPSAEIDISCHICGGSGCNICKHSGWVEIGGSGMIDPNVFTNTGIDPVKYTGFAFGMGIERITMLKYQINDLRLFSENDVRFLRQF
ncbi:MAG: phenylalanine--tRNA ligase subunit alpha [Cytophagales bacterium]|nr:phenylalanine--tRNA ligase subunit alpha [Cytophagales bacterium]